MRLPRLRPEIIHWASGVNLGEARETVYATVERHTEGEYREDWTRIGGSVVPCCKDCGVILAGKNGLKRHNDLHQRLSDLNQDIAYLYEYLGIGDNNGGHDGESSEDPEGIATGPGSEVHGNA